MAVPTLGAGVRRGLVRACLAAATVASSLAVASQVTIGTAVAPSADNSQPAPVWPARAERLEQRYACSSTGLRDGTIPAHAVVKVGRRVRLTSFDAGWAIFLNRRAGTLLSVCAR